MNNKSPNTNSLHSKYFKHYKNKPYRYIGEAKHSEELKDYVIYECLYPNDLAKIWIRPKDMFFESAQFQGETQPRFKAVDFSIKTYEHISSDVENIIFPLCKKVFTEFNETKFRQRLTGKTNIKLYCFYYADELAGFKLGYELDIFRYYSWLGGVDEKFRRLGVAEHLMQTQHDWAKSQKYKYIETKSENRHKGMIILNLKSGFDIIGTETSPSHQLKILFQKKL